MFDDKLRVMEGSLSPNRNQQLLALYRDRYDIEDMIEPFERLEEAQCRRERKLAVLRRRAGQLASELSEVTDRIGALEKEINGTEVAREALAAEIVEETRLRFTETWSPIPVLGYRTWVIHQNRLRGVKVPWPTPEMVASCLTRIPGEDVPHAERRCGIPACGIYATKTLQPFSGTAYGLAGRELALGVVAMTGKVIEHDVGYRAARARAVAVVARLDRTWFATADEDAVAELFTDPRKAATRLEPADVDTRRQAESLLIEMKEKAESWT